MTRAFAAALGLTRVEFATRVSAARSEFSRMIRRAVDVREARDFAV